MIRRVNGRMNGRKQLFLVRLAPHEKALLSFLSTESGESMSGVVKRLIFQEAALKSGENRK
jgi:hypothetical protein